MLKRILRAALPILLVLLGVGLVAYGVRAHVITVVLTPEKAETPAPSAEKPAAPAEEEPEMPPPPPPGDPWMSPPRDPWMGGPARDPWMGAPPEEPSGEDDEPSAAEEAPSDESVEKRPAEKKPAAEPAEPTTSQDLEPTLIYDVTIGGVSRSETGQIFRTYVADAGGKPPALCPT